MAEPIFDIVPPDGACRVRIKTRFPQKGNTPMILCDSLTHASVEDAIQDSESLHRYVKSLCSKGKLTEDCPWTLKGDLEFLGSDGLPIDAPREIEFLYYGERKDANKKKKGPLVRMMKVMEERERAHQAALTQLGTSFQASLAQLGSLYKAAVEQTPNAALIEEIRQVRATESQRATDATKDVVTLLQGRPGKPKESLVSELAPWLPVLKSLLPN